MFEKDDDFMAKEMQLLVKNYKAPDHVGKNFEDSRRWWEQRFYQVIAWDQNKAKSNHVPWTRKDFLQRLAAETGGILSLTKDFDALLDAYEELHGAGGTPGADSDSRRSEKGATPAKTAPDAPSQIRHPAEVDDPSESIPLRTPEAAAFLGISVHTLHQLTSQHKIAFSKPNGKSMYFKTSDLRAWLKQNYQTKLDGSGDPR